MGTGPRTEIAPVVAEGVGTGDGDDGTGAGGGGLGTGVGENGLGAGIGEYEVGAGAGTGRGLGDAPDPGLDKGSPQIGHSVKAVGTGILWPQLAHFIDGIAWTPSKQRQRISKYRNILMKISQGRSQ